MYPLQYCATILMVWSVLLLVDLELLQRFCESFMPLNRNQI